MYAKLDVVLNYFDRDKLIFPNMSDSKINKTIKLVKNWRSKFSLRLSVFRFCMQDNNKKGRKNYFNTRMSQASLQNTSYIILLCYYPNLPLT